jgi:tungstate transport system permease protein
MAELWLGIAEALRLVASLDASLYEIIGRSLQVTLTAVAIASALGIPLGVWLALSHFPGHRLLVALLNALMGLPPVVVGLIVYLMLSRTGPLGVLGLLYTPTAMIIAQVIIILPLIASVSLQSTHALWQDYRALLLSLNANRWQRITTLIWDGRRSLLTAVLAGFGRGIGEVGAVMIVGGNFDHLTRVLTTAISLETSKGNFAQAIALGLVLITLATGISLVAHLVLRKEHAPIDQ